MPIVFVHGVATRMSPDYARAVALRDALFKETALAGIVESTSSVVVTNPYWGGCGVTFAWDHASVPGKKYESFGTSQELASDLLANTVDTLPNDLDTTLVTIARTSPQSAIDVLFGMTAFDDTQIDPVALVKLASQALAYFERHPTPAWLSEVTTDMVFIDRLRLAIDEEVLAAPPATETFGTTDLVGALKTAAMRVAQVAGDLIAGYVRANTETLVAHLRPALDARITSFIGDVFVYLNQRGTPTSQGAIVTTVAEAIEAAARSTANRKRDPIIVVAHSLGGEIAYDVLTHFRPDLCCDVLVTVGSQVALFEEMKLFGASDHTLVGPKPVVPKPPGVKCWINVYDSHDILSYVAAPVFTDVQDYHFDTGKTVLGAHSAYFLRPTFHRRLNARLRAALQ